MGKLLLKPIQFVARVYFTNIQILEYILNCIVEFIENQIKIKNVSIRVILTLIYDDESVKKAFENLYKSFFNTKQQKRINDLINKILISNSK
jgi:hypothetical protein